MDWTTKISPPRTFSVISTAISPSLNVRISAVPRELPWEAHISLASGRFEFPANIFNTASHMTRALTTSSQKGSWGGRTRTCECRDQNPVPYLTWLLPIITAALSLSLSVFFSSHTTGPTRISTRPPYRTGYPSIPLSFDCRMKSAYYRKSDYHSRPRFLAPFLRKVYCGY